MFDSPAPINNGPKRTSKGQGSSRWLSRSIRDFDEVALAFHTWDARFRQMSLGAFSGELQFLNLGSVKLLNLTCNRVLQARGIQRDRSRYLFSLVVPKSEGACWRGRRLRAGQINVLQPTETMDHCTAADYESLTLMIDVDALQKAAAALYRIDIQERLCGSLFVTPLPSDNRRLERYLRHLVRKGKDEISSPHHERECIERLLQLLVRSPGFTGVEDRPCNRRQIAHRARDLMEADLRRVLTASDLCVALDVSKRALEYAFDDQFGLSPMAFFKTMKLNAVRYALKSANVDSVHHIARQWGFHHTGAFAADYRRLFGELPSRTRDHSR